MDQWAGGHSGGNHCYRTEIKKRMQKKEDSLRNIWDNIKDTNPRSIGVPEDEREKGPEKIFEQIIAESQHGKEKQSPKSRK